MNKERVVIACYKPFSGKENELKELVEKHIDVLINEGLVTNRKPTIIQSENGTILEVFGWKSKEAIELAHSNPNIQKLWEAFNQVCTYVPLSELTESKNLFSEFTPLN